jgi:PEGA domain-containing protein
MFAIRAHRVIGLLVSICVLAFGASALGAAPGPDALPVHVVAVKSEEALDQAEALTQALRKAIRDSDGWSLGDSSQSLEFLAVKMGCQEPIDAACETRIADVLKADRYLWAVIQFEDKAQSNIVGTLNFYVRGKGTNKVPLKYTANLTDPTMDALIEVARDAVSKATGGPPKGTLKISTGGVAGQLYIDEKPVGALPAEGTELQLPAGDHHLLVKAPGYADAEATASVKPATSVEVSLTMVEQAEDKPIDGRLVGGIAALAVGVGTGAVGLWAALEVNKIRNDDAFTSYQDGFSDATNVCEQADLGVPSKGNPTVSPADVSDQCGKASTYEILQAVMFPVAGVAAGVGIFLLGTSSLAGGDEDAAIVVQPIVGPGLAAAAVTARF